MKRVILLGAGLALLAATTVTAGIRNTKHDLSTSNNVASFAVAGEKGSYTELCVYCHTPHGADTSQLAPLWNRSIAPSLVASDLYNSATLNKTYSAPTVVAAGVNASDARLCLTCHDGASLTKDLVNPPNSGGSKPSANIPGTSAANLYKDSKKLQDDHPIGMNYRDLQTVEGVAEFNANISPLTLYNTTGGDHTMWCSTCHDVHNNTNQPFLALSNTGSALCLKCHNK